MGNASSGGGTAPQEVATVLDELRRLERSVNSIHTLQRHESVAISQRLAALGQGEQVEETDHRREKEQGANDGKDARKDSEEQTISSENTTGRPASRGRTRRRNNSSLRDSLAVFGSHAQVGRARVIVGPVVGLVDSNSARILLEVDTDSELTIHCCLCDKYCPGGREVSSVSLRAVAFQPVVFQVNELPPGTRFHFCFSGISKDDTIARAGSFRTQKPDAKARIAGVCGTSPGLAADTSDKENDVWRALRTRVDNRELDLVVHCGGQADLRGKFDRCALMLERLGPESDAPQSLVQKTEARVLDELRNVYRFAWNSPDIQHVLANVSNLMIWGDLDIPSLPARNSLPKTRHDRRLAALMRMQDERATGAQELSYPARLVVLAQRVFREYQRALWRKGTFPMQQPEDMVWGPHGSGNEEHYFVRPWPQLGLLFMDTRSSQFNPDGSPTPWPAAPMVSQAQWEAMRATLSENGDLQNLLVVTDRPVVRCGPSLPNTESGHDAWEANPREQSAMLNMLFAWKSRTQVTLLCGAGPYDLGAVTKLRCEDYLGTDHFREEITQLTVPPAHACFGPDSDKLQYPTGEGEGERGVIQATRIKDDEPENPYFQSKQLTQTLYHHSLINVASGDQVCGRGLLRMFAAISATTGTLDQDEKRVRARLVPAALYERGGATDVRPSLLLGPIVGKVSHDSAVVLVEVDYSCRITCVLTDTLTGQIFQQVKRIAPAREAVTFVFKGCLLSDRTYRMKIPELEEDGHGKAGFHTMPSPMHAALGVEHRLTLFAAVKDAPLHAYGAKENLWGVIDAEACRQTLEPCATLHIGAVDLCLVEDELRAVAKRFRKRPCDLSSDESVQAKQGIRRAVQGVYHTMWGFPHVAKTFSGGANLFLVSEADIEEPPSFRTAPDLIPWRETIRTVAMQVATEYQQALNGVPDEEENRWLADQAAAAEKGALVPLGVKDVVGEDPRAPGAEQLPQCQFQGLHMLGGCVGLLLISSLTEARVRGAADYVSPTRGATSPMLNAYDWARLDQAVQLEAKNLKCLVIATDTPVLSDSPLDALTKSCASGEMLRAVKGWPCHETECLRLLDLAFAWQTDQHGRAAHFLSAAPDDCSGSFETDIEHTFNKPKAVVRQLCLAPITAPIYSLATGLPFALQGTADAPRVVGARIKEPRYKYTHRSINMGQNAFGVLRIGTKRTDNVHSIRAQAISDAKGLNVASEFSVASSIVEEIPLCASTLGALASGERAKQKRLENAEQTRSLNAITEQRKRSENEIKQAYPEMKFPEEAVQFDSPDQDQDQDQDQSERQETKVGDSGESANAKSNKRGKQKAPRASMAAEMDRLDFKWLDFDPQVYGQQVKDKLDEWQKMVAQEDKSEFRDTLETCFRLHKEEKGGVPFSSINALTRDFFVENVSSLVEEMCLPSRNSPKEQPNNEKGGPNLNLFVEMLTWAVLKRRFDAMKDRLRVQDSLSLSEVLNICASVGACAIISKPRLGFQ